MLWSITKAVDKWRRTPHRSPKIAHVGVHSTRAPHMCDLYSMRRSWVSSVGPDRSPAGRRAGGSDIRKVRCMRLALGKVVMWFKSEKWSCGLKICKIRKVLYLLRRADNHVDLLT